MRAEIVNRINGFLWLGLVALLPVTSLPLARALFGSSMVAPPSTFFLLGLVILFLLPALLRGAALPPQSKPLLGFAMVAIVASLAAVFLSFPIFREVNFVRHMLEALVTLAIGLCFYLVSATWTADEGRLNATLRWINWSGLVMILWSLFQAVAIRLAENDYPLWMQQAQELISVGRLYYMRSTGFAFEPSWLAHQLNVLYLPLWLAASVRRSSVHRFRLFLLSFENLLLLLGAATLWLSVSRVGLLAFLLAIGYLLVLGNLWLADWLQNRLLPRLRPIEPSADDQAAPPKPPPLRWHSFLRPLSRLGILILLAAMYAGLLFGAAQALSRVDERMKSMFDFTNLRQNGFLAYANQLVFAERIVFWQLGWDVFNDYPWQGVGLGNTGYYFLEKMNSFGWELPEVNHIAFQEDGVPNSKSLWTRLLAETGLFGFAMFLAWLVGLFLTGRSLGCTSGPLPSTLGLAAQLGLIALILEGFSLDTFALPYFWVLFGLATAAWILKNRAPISKTVELA